MEEGRRGDWYTSIVLSEMSLAEWARLRAGSGRDLDHMTSHSLHPLEGKVWCEGVRVCGSVTPTHAHNASTHVHTHARARTYKHTHAHTLTLTHTPQLLLVTLLQQSALLPRLDDIIVVTVLAKGVFVAMGTARQTGIITFQ